MANYNTFIVVDCNSRKSILTTSSARNAKKALDTGYRIEVWNANEKRQVIYATTSDQMIPYLQEEKEYIRKKQARAEARNKLRKRKVVVSG